MQNPQMKRLLQGAWTLSLAAMIAKILSAIYRVPFQNLVGDTGFYVYQQVYPLYGIGMTFALSGFPVFISKLVAEAREPDAQAAVTHQAQVLLTWLSWAMFFGLFGFSKAIASAMADPQLAALIQTVAFMFLTMPILATGRGYFQGTFDMSKTAVSQVVEQVIRVAVILLAASVATKAHWDPYKMGVVAMSGAFFGGLAATGTLWPAFHRVFAKRHFAWPGFGSYWHLLKRFVVEGGSIALFAAMLIMLQLVDSFTVTRGLQASGVPFALAKSLKGVYDRGQPLVQLGLVVATALSATLLPSLTTAFARGQHQRFDHTAAQLIRFNLALSTAATAGLVVVMPAVNWLLFGDRSGQLALQTYVIAIVLVAMINAYNAILQSLNRYRGTTRVLMIGFVVKLLSNQWLVTRLGTLGASVSTLLALLVITGLLAIQVPMTIRQVADRDHFYLKLTAITAAMVIVVDGVMAVMPFASREQAILVAGVAVVVGVIVFVLGATWVHLFTAREVLALPLGRRFLKMTHKRK
ncbi:polysaccharide biosynthesis protein [Lacticaseibacillus sp. N501-2]|uniref:polysaccharide biosynthesis protein n=1 Tax=Lacticaseibacillus salsurae TaxID=3367729 RepID=UPI0038B38C47